jgi:hypothetical protein
MSIDPRKQRKFKKKLFLVTISLLFFAFLTTIYFVQAYLNEDKLISPVGEAHVTVIEIKKSLDKNKVNYSSIKKSSDLIYKIQLQNSKAIVTLEKDIDEQISSLQRILRAYTIEGKEFKSIDFRFSEPVISF